MLAHMLISVNVCVLTIPVCCFVQSKDTTTLPDPRQKLMSYNTDVHGRAIVHATNPRPARL